jgi:hypothetical protein
MEAYEPTGVRIGTQLLVHSVRTRRLCTRQQRLTLAVSDVSCTVRENRAGTNR